MSVTILDYRSHADLSPQTKYMLQNQMECLVWLAVTEGRALKLAVAEVWNCGNEREEFEELVNSWAEYENSSLRSVQGHFFMNINLRRYCKKHRHRVWVSEGFCAL